MNEWGTWPFSQNPISVKMMFDILSPIEISSYPLPLLLYRIWNYRSNLRHPQRRNTEKEWTIFVLCLMYMWNSYFKLGLMLQSIQVGLQLNTLGFSVWYCCKHIHRFCHNLSLTSLKMCLCYWWLCTCGDLPGWSYLITRNIGIKKSDWKL